MNISKWLVCLCIPLTLLIIGTAVNPDSGLVLIANGVWALIMSVMKVALNTAMFLSPILAAIMIGRYVHVNKQFNTPEDESMNLMCALASGASAFIFMLITPLGASAGVFLAALILWGAISDAPSRDFAKEEKDVRSLVWTLSAVLILCVGGFMGSWFHNLYAGTLALSGQYTPIFNAYEKGEPDAELRAEVDGQMRDVIEEYSVYGKHDYRLWLLDRAPLEVNTDPDQIFSPAGAGISGENDFSCSDDAWSAEYVLDVALVTRLCALKEEHIEAENVKFSTAVLDSVRQGRFPHSTIYRHPEGGSRVALDISNDEKSVFRCDSGLLWNTEGLNGLSEEAAAAICKTWEKELDWEQPFYGEP